MKRAFNDGGLSNVFLNNGYIIYNHPHYGEGISHEDIFQLTDQVSVALSIRPGRLRGTEFRYIRRAMQIPQIEIARIFNRTELTIANWEKHNKVPAEASLLMKQLCLRHYGHQGQVAGTLDQLGDNDFSDAEIVMAYDSSEQSWKSNFHPHQVVEKCVVTNQPSSILDIYKNAMISALSLPTTKTSRATGILAKSFIIESNYIATTAINNQSDISNYAQDDAEEESICTSMPAYIANHYNGQPT